MAIQIQNYETRTLEIKVKPPSFGSTHFTIHFQDSGDIALENSYLQFLTLEQVQKIIEKCYEAVHLHNTQELNITKANDLLPHVPQTT